MPSDDVSARISIRLLDASHSTRFRNAATASR